MDIFILEHLASNTNGINTSQIPSLSQKRENTQTNNFCISESQNLRQAGDKKSHPQLSLRCRLASQVKVDRQCNENNNNFLKKRKCKRNLCVRRLPFADTPSPARPHDKSNHEMQQPRLLATCAVQNFPMLFNDTDSRVIKIASVQTSQPFTYFMEFYPESRSYKQGDNGSWTLGRRVVLCLLLLLQRAAIIN